MRPTRRLNVPLLAAAALVFSACQSVTVGIECTERADCAPAQECFTGTKLPAGFCSKGCSEAGSGRECPGGTYCTPFVGGMQLCAPTCTETTDCRINYKCEASAPNAPKTCRADVPG